MLAAAVVFGVCVEGGKLKSAQRYGLVIVLVAENNCACGWIVSSACDDEHRAKRAVVDGRANTLVRALSLAIVEARPGQGTRSNQGNGTKRTNRCAMSVRVSPPDADALQCRSTQSVHTDKCKT